MSDIRESIRQIRAGDSNRKVGAAVGLDHKTVARLRDWAEAQGWLAPGQELPEAELLDREWRAKWGRLPRQNLSPLRALEGEIRALRDKGLSKRVVYRELRARSGFDSSYSAVCHFISQIEGPANTVTVRVETAPGEEAQVDFGFAGQMYDPVRREVRKCWAFVMTLSWSRHQYVEFVFDQKVGTWLRAHQRAFEAFGGVPARVRIDNLKTAITRACQDAPDIQRAYRECAEHYGFVITPCRVATPQHKGKVERGVAYVAGNFLAGKDYTQPHAGAAQANADVKGWVREEAGCRVHGTTRQAPLARFEQIERAALQGLPSRPYEGASWTTLKLHRDCHIVFEQSYYSGPYRLVGQRLAVRATLTTVQLYDTTHALVATHTRAAQPGERKTNLIHLPPDKVAGLALEMSGASLSELRARAAGMGPSIAAVIDAILEDSVVDKRRAVLRLLRHGDRLGVAALELACLRAMDSGDPTPFSVRNWIKIGQSREAVQLLDVDTRWPAATASLAQRPVFARSVEELLPAVAWADTGHMPADGLTRTEAQPCL